MSLYIFTLTDQERFDFMMNLTSWAQGWSKAELSLCTAFNFGYTGDLAMSQISLVTNIDKHPNMDLGTLGMRAVRRCSIVIISGKFISEIDAVMDVIKDVSEVTITMPLSVFLMEGPDPAQKRMTFNISARSHNSPFMVSIFTCVHKVAGNDVLCRLLFHTSELAPDLIFTILI